jgi:hypothetical protein
MGATGSSLYKESRDESSTTGVGYCAVVEGDGGGWTVVFVRSFIPASRPFRTPGSTSLGSAVSSSLKVRSESDPVCVACVTKLTISSATRRVMQRVQLSWYKRNASAA